MTDRDILGQIDELIAEEHDLRSRHTGEGLGETERVRLRRVEEQLDQCWDLLRRRRASREAGEDPDGVRPRPVSEVESYQQ